MKNIIKSIVDDGDFSKHAIAQNIIVGFARMNYSTVGVIANHLKFYGFDVNSSIAAVLLDFAIVLTFLITFTDVPGYLPGVSQEHSGIIRYGKLLYAYSEATVPKLMLL